MHLRVPSKVTNNSFASIIEETKNGVQEIKNTFPLNAPFLTRQYVAHFLRDLLTTNYRRSNSRKGKMMFFMSYGLSMSPDIKMAVLINISLFF